MENHDQPLKQPQLIYSVLGTATHLGTTGSFRLPEPGQMCRVAVAFLLHFFNGSEVSEHLQQSPLDKQTKEACSFVTSHKVAHITQVPLCCKLGISHAKFLLHGWALKHDGWAAAG